VGAVPLLTNTEPLDPAIATLVIVSFTNMYFIEYNLVTAAAVVSMLPILDVFLACQKWIVRGVVMSGLKG
jgi:multiple sugar transport system permease protein